MLQALQSSFQQPGSAGLQAACIARNVGPQWAEAKIAIDHLNAKPDICASACHAGLQVDDMSKAAGVVADMRKVFRQDTRVIQKLHRRVFLDKITQEQV